MRKIFRRAVMFVAGTFAAVGMAGCGGATLDGLGDLDSVEVSTGAGSEERAYAIVDTGQDACFDTVEEIACPFSDESFYGQDGTYRGPSPSYTDNGDGTVTDEVTGLMWQQDPGDKMTYDDAVAGADDFTLAGYTDWRLPTIKELYSLIVFSGVDPIVEEGANAELTPFIDTNYFAFQYGDEESGERIIDAQFASGTEYVSTTMGGNPTVFGVNFADGRIKGYPQINKEFFILYVRGNEGYGQNEFVSNGDDTTTDDATGLMWMAVDSGDDGLIDDAEGYTYDDGSLTWEEALDFCEMLDFAEYDDWRLPHAKELQSIVDYTRSPATTDSAAIDDVFETTAVTDEGGDINYPFYWTGTTHRHAFGGEAAAYVAFGEALGWMTSPYGGYELQDVHGAGAQRSDPKAGDPADYPYGFGPQGDVRRIYNYARCVRDAV